MTGGLKYHNGVRLETEKYKQLSMGVLKNHVIGTTSAFSAACRSSVPRNGERHRSPDENVPCATAVSLELEAAVSGQQSHKNSNPGMEGDRGQSQAFYMRR